MLSKLVYFLQQPLLLLQAWFTPAQMPPPPVGQFVLGVNLGGEAVTVEGYPWQSYRRALDAGLSTPGASATQSYVVPQPFTQASVRKMLNSGIYRPNALEIDQTLPNGSYDVYLWLMENYKTDWRSLDVSTDGRLAARGVGQLDRGGWFRYGPYPVTVTSGVLHLTLASSDPDRHAHAMGFSVFKP